MVLLQSTNRCKKWIRGKKSKFDEDFPVIYFVKLVPSIPVMDQSWSFEKCLALVNEKKLLRQSFDNSLITRKIYPFNKRLRIYRWSSIPFLHVEIHAFACGKVMHRSNSMWESHRCKFRVIVTLWHALGNYSISFM